MQIEVTLTPAELRATELTGKTAVVIDELRASSTIVQALANGARAVLPVASIPEARKRARQMDDVLLGGERGGLKIPGFDLGNSPSEYTRGRVAGKTIVLTTTNGTRAIRIAAARARRVLIGCFHNYSALMERLPAEGRPVVLACAAHEGKPVLDDTVCAGMMVEGLLGGRNAPSLNDSALIARAAFHRYRGRLLDALKESASGRALIGVGLEEDLAYCAQVAAVEVVPELVGEVLVSEPAKVRPAGSTDLPQAKALLALHNLPLEGVAEHFADFLVVPSGSELAGVAGLELYGNAALLRSVAVQPQWQGRGLGASLTSTALKKARDAQAEHVYLLTTTAASFFERFGFLALPWDQVDERVKVSAEFQGACPDTATAMHLRLAQG